MVSAVRRGESMRSVARRFHVTLSTVQRWVRRAGDARLDRVPLVDRAPGCRASARRTSTKLETAIVHARQTLRQSSALGEYGAVAIRRSLLADGLQGVPSARTVGRVLERLGALDGRTRVRRPPPPPGWYLPGLRSATAELDSFDIVEGLVIRGGTRFEVLNGISLRGRIVDSWPVESLVTARFAVDSLISRWRIQGLPDYAQFDNDTIFQGAHHVPDTFGRITRLCQQLGVVAVFATPNEQGFQATIEAYNGVWQRKVWNRFEHHTLESLQARSDAFVAAHRSTHARPERVQRRSFPQDWTLDLTRPLCGSVSFLRRTNESGEATVLGHRMRLSTEWPNRLVRADVDLDESRIRFFSLRRREPEDQTLLREVRYRPVDRPFQDK